MKILRLNQLQAAYLDRGEGIPVILAHCSSASHREWGSLAKKLSQTRRVLAPGLLGYGASSPWPKRGCAPDTDIDVIETLIAEARAPVDLVGHSYGGAVCLEVALRDALSGTGLVRSLCLVEPVSFHLLAPAGRLQEWDRISTVGRHVIAACEMGDPRRAANHYMGFWLGWTKWRLAPAPFRREVVRTMLKVGCEFGTMFERDACLADYSRITCPLSLIKGGRSPAPAKAVVDVLAGIMQDVRQSVLKDAGHMSPFTHRDAVERLIITHLDRQAAVMRASELNSPTYA